MEKRKSLVRCPTVVILPKVLLKSSFRCCLLEHCGWNDTSCMQCDSIIVVWQKSKDQRTVGRCHDMVIFTHSRLRPDINRRK